MVGIVKASDTMVDVGWSVPQLRIPALHGRQYNGWPNVRLILCTAVYSYRRRGTVCLFLFFFYRPCMPGQSSAP